MKKKDLTQKALAYWGVILFIWSIYRMNVRLPEWFDEFVAKPFVFIIPVYYFVTGIEKQKDFFEGIYLKLTSSWKEYALGISVGTVFIITALFAGFVRNNSLVFIFKNIPTVSFMLLSVALAFATGITEEIVSRGFILKRLFKESGNIYTSSFFASILFFFLHVPMLFTNQKITGNTLLMFMITDMLLSLVNSFIFLMRKNLTAPIIIHALYNLSILFFL